MKIKSILFNFENILLFFWIGCLFSINSKISDIFYEKNNSLNIIIIFLRIIIPIITFLILIFFLRIKKIKLFILSYFIYAVWMLIVYNFNKENLITNLEKYHLIISMISILLIIHIMEYSEFKNLHLKILYSSIIFISLISLYFAFFLLYELFQKNETYYLYYNASFVAEGKNLLQVNPRITGISRMLGLVFLFIFSLYICKKKKIYNYFFLLIIFFLSFLIYGMQSKGSYISIVLLVFYYLIFFKDKVKKKFSILFFIVVLPIISYETIVKIKFEANIKIKSEASGKEKAQILRENIIINRFLSDNLIIINDIEVKDYTTGRFEIWKRSVKEIADKKIIFGKGPQADRLLLKSKNFNPSQPTHFYDSNASNGLIYSYLCAGIIGLFFILSIYLLIIYEIYKSIFLHKAFIYKDSYSIFSILTLSFLTTRTIYENGFAIFGIDFIFTIISYFVLKKQNSKKINTKLY